MQKNVIFAVQTGKQRLKQVVKAPPKNLQSADA